MNLPTIELARELQNELGLRDTHLVWIGETGFTIAHTDQERAAIDLTDCLLHRAMMTLDTIPPGVDIGWHIVVNGGECLFNIIPLDLHMNAIDFTVDL